MMTELQALRFVTSEYLMTSTSAGIPNHSQEIHDDAHETSTSGRRLRLGGDHH